MKTVDCDIISMIIFPVEIWYIGVVDGEGDVAEGLAVDLLVPVENLTDSLLSLLDLIPVQKWLLTNRRMYAAPEQRVLDLKAQLWLEVRQVGYLGPVGHVLEDVVGLVEGVLGGEGFQELDVNISLNEFVKILNVLDF